MRSGGPVARLARSAHGGAVDAATVLIIDDAAANVVLLEHHLTSLGVARVHTITDARTAVDACLELSPDLLLLDLHMPYVDGYAILHELHERLPVGDFLPILVLTADATADARERALDAGANDFLTKPFDRVEVMQRSRNLLELRALYQGLRHSNRALHDELEREREQKRATEAERSAANDLIDTALGDAVLGSVYQPIVDLADGSVRGFEALARFDCEPRRPPDQWFAAADSIGRRHELELAAFDRAVANLERLPAGTRMWLNASPDLVATTAFTERLERLDGSRVVVELTESTAIGDYAALLQSIDAARSLGMQIAVDDAGAGYAGLQQIVRLRPDIVKLDRELVHGIESDPVLRALTTSLVSFGRDTGCVIVAEGIERQAELDTLVELGVDWGQGYLLGRPAPIDAWGGPA